MSNIRVNSEWADIVELAPKNWQYTVGYFLEESNTCVIYERRSNISTDPNATNGMEAAYQRMCDFIQSKQP